MLLALSLAALLPAVTAFGSGGTGGPSGPGSSGASGDTRTAGQAPAVQAALQDAAALYAMNCAVCHGRTGGGLQEARTAFPPDERRCVRCHKPNNPVVQPLSLPFVDNDMFPVGNPPALHAVSQPTDAPGTSSVGGGAAPMAEAVAPEALFHYIKATMPRYEPGRHSDAEYWLLAAYLLEMNGREEALDSAVAAATSAGWTH